MAQRAPQGTPETVVYVSNAGSKEVFVLAMNRATGALELIEKTPVPGTDKPSPASLPMACSASARSRVASRSSGSSSGSGSGANAGAESSTSTTRPGLSAENAVACTLV